MLSHIKTAFGVLAKPVRSEASFTDASTEELAMIAISEDKSEADRLRAVHQVARYGWEHPNDLDFYLTVFRSWYRAAPANPKVRTALEGAFNIVLEVGRNTRGQSLSPHHS